APDVRAETHRRAFIRANKKDKPIGDDQLIVKRDKIGKIERDQHLLVKRDRIDQIERDDNLSVGGKSATSITGSMSVEVKGDVIEEFKSNHSEQVGTSYYVKAMTVVIEASLGLTIQVGGN